MSRAQREADIGDAHNDGVNIVQLQWEAHDAVEAAIVAYKAWANAATAAEPEATRYVLGCDLGAKYAKLRRARVPRPGNVVQLVPADHHGDKPYWGE